MRYAFIGLGNLGRHLAANLLRHGFSLTVHDLEQTAATPLLDAGARWADSPAQAVHGAEALITCLPSPAATRAVLTGESGAFRNLPSGSTWIEMSTNDPNEIGVLAQTAAAAGIATLEAPVTGGVHKAASGQITVLAGGSAELVAAHHAALAAMGDPVIHVGTLGQASVVKVITNMLAFLHLLGVGEALALARQAGVDLRTAFAAIKASSGNSFVHETESQVILSGSYNIGFTMDLACKDADFAVELGRRFGVPLEMGKSVARIFREARERYGGAAWSPEVVRPIEEAIGAGLRTPGFPDTLDSAPCPGNTDGPGPRNSGTNAANFKTR